VTTQPLVDETIRAEIYRWAYRFLRNHHDALDATQDVLVKWLKVSGEHIESRKAWLRRTTTNHCIDLLRRKRTTSTPQAERIDTQTPLATASDRELREAIAAGLAKLSDQQRAVVVAKVYDRETFASIAESMGLSVSSVKTHYLRGLRGLREAVAHRAGG
jgi:RNA polymerase sigma-70 factor (ECF subfamily)